MDHVLLALAVLACPIGMGAMMWVMTRGMRRREDDRSRPEPGDVSQLRAEHQRLGEEIERLDTDATGAESEPAATRR